MARKMKESVARPIAPEDIGVGSYISVLHVIAERVPGCWCDVDPLQKLQTRRYVRLPCDDANDPLLVMQVCLPFVFAKQANGDLRTLDVRRYRFVQLEKSYARRVHNLLKVQAKSGKRKKDENDEDGDD